MAAPAVRLCTRKLVRTSTKEEIKGVSHSTGTAACRAMCHVLCEEGKHGTIVGNKLSVGKKRHSSEFLVIIFSKYCCICCCMVLRRIFGPRRDEVTGEWRRLYNEELNDLYSSPNIVRVIKSRRIRWAGHVARMGEERGRIGSWWGNWRERENWGDLSVDGWIILGWISRKWDVGMWTGLGWPRIGTGGGRL